MNSLKTLAVVAVLAAVAYGVYVTIHHTPPPAPPPPGGWPAGPEQQIPDMGSVTPQFGQPGGLEQGGSAGPGGMTPPGAGQATGIPPIGAPGAAGYPSADPGSGAGGPAGVPPIPGGRWPADPAGSQPDAAAPPDPTAPTGSYPGQFPADPPGGATPPYPGQALGMSEAPGYPGASSQAPAADGVPGAVPGTSAEGTPGNDVRARFEELMKAVEQKLAAGELAEAHLALSSLYGNPKLPVEMSHQVIDLLDQLAGTVIYSREHYLEDPYTVQPGDTMETIAAKYDVPWQVLARINGVRGPEDLQPGGQLKVIRGPFSAVVDLDKYELTLMLGRRYAGRFPIGVGEDQMRLEGTYTVQGKVPNPPYNGPDGMIPADDPNNPLGELYIDLGHYVGLHGTNDPGELHRTVGRGTVRLADRDIDDLYGMLSVGSEVVIRR